MKGNDISDGCGNSWSRCELGRHCGMHVVRPGKVACWCNDADDSKLEVFALKQEIEELTEYVAALEDVCTPEQLREARKAMEL